MLRYVSRAATKRVSLWPTTFVRPLSSSQSSSSLIVHVAGADRLGIVSDVTALVTQAGGNVGESVAGRLGPHYFSLMLLVDGVPESQRETLQQQIRAVPDLESAVFSVTTPTSARTSRPHIAYSGSFRVTGADHPGIVHQVTNVLAAHGLSIDQLRTTDQAVAPHGGTTLFTMHGIATCAAPLPSSFDVAEIAEELEAVGDAMNCEITLEDSLDEAYGGEDILAG